MRKKNLQIGKRLKSILISFVFSFLINVCFAQSIPAENLFLGPTPPGNSSKI
jgi:hypothetical protein